MYKIKVLIQGRVRDDWAEAAFRDYVRRLKGKVELETVWTKDDAALLRHAQRERRVVCLDVQGEQMTSEAFASCVMRELEAGGARLAFVIGGAEGLPVELRQGAYTRISLGKMTLTHQLARVVLAEQIYRSIQIAEGSPYHK